MDAENWAACAPYLRGVDLWNHGYYWEAHEEWESLWHAAGRSGFAADFFKGLIQLAVAGVKVRENRAESVVRHARRAVDLFKSSQANGNMDVYFGLSLTELARLAAEIANEPPENATPDRDKVRIVFSRPLTPAHCPSS